MASTGVSPNTNPLLAEAVKAVSQGGAEEPARELAVSDVIVKTGALLLAVIAGAVVGWTVLPYNFLVVMVLAIGAVGVGIAAARKRTPGPALPAVYSVLQGLIVGSFSALMAATYGGEIVSTALMATLAVFAVCLGLNFVPAIRYSSKGRRFFTVAIIGYLVLSLVSIGFAFFAGTGGGWGFFGLGAFGIMLSVGAVALSSWSLLISFGAVDEAMRAGASEKYGWILSMGLIVSIVWVYLEILRLLALTRR